MLMHQKGTVKVSEELFIHAYIIDAAQVYNRRENRTICNSRLVRQPGCFAAVPKSNRYK
jgi:hypothetical protein